MYIYDLNDIYIYIYIYVERERDKCVYMYVYLSTHAHTHSYIYTSIYIYIYRCVYMYASLLRCTSSEGGPPTSARLAGSRDTRATDRWFYANRARDRLGVLGSRGPEPDADTHARTHARTQGWIRELHWSDISINTYRIFI